MTTWRVALAAWLVSRAILLLAAYYTLVFNPPGATRDHGHVVTPSSLRVLLHSWQQWDATWYLEIAHTGYFSEQSTAFFPLFPALARGLTAILGGRLYLAAGLIVANLAALGALWAVAHLAVDEDGIEAPAPALRLMMAFPTAFFLFAPYSESVFIALATASLVAARRGRWGWAAAAAFGAGLTRPTAVALVLPLAYEYGRQAGWWERPIGPGRLLADPRRLGMGVLTTMSAPLALLAYAAFLAFRFGQPLVFLSAQARYWHRHAEAPWTTAWTIVSHLVATPPFSYEAGLQLLDLTLVTGAILLLVRGWRHLPAMLSLYLAGILLLAVATPILYQRDVLVSSSRFMLTATPAFLLLAKWSRGRPWLDLLLVGGGFALQAVLLSFYLSGGWVA